MKKTAAIVVLAVFLVAGAFTQTIGTLKAGSSERQVVADALRASFKKQVANADVKFKISTLATYKEWVFLVFEPLQPNGKPFDWGKTKYAEAFRDGVLDKLSNALLHREGRKWIVKEMVIGPTDVAYEPWPKRYKLPRKLFGLP